MDDHLELSLFYDMEDEILVNLVRPSFTNDHEPAFINEGLECLETYLSQQKQEDRTAARTLLDAVDATGGMGLTKRQVYVSSVCQLQRIIV